ncbi:TPA: hypothetical protein DIC38_02030 [Candidatus Nomurabacteria bacterium]|nr:MAG: hypothetical protein O210_OD1C00001G0326 [Parcubacteria bacterium RAAC4_OD1_1]HCY26435.1 hypothetical protein [Candidatus Nomurabacteria bacterium]
MNQEKFIKQPTIKERYLSKVDSEGYLRLGEISRGEFGGRQVKNIASLLDGSEGVNLGEGLRYNGNSGNYSDMKIHIDDLESFIEKVKEFYK